jgi:predicted nucleotidyltransferase
MKLEDHLSEKLGVKVDLVTPDALKPLIKSNILQETVYA